MHVIKLSILSLAFLTEAHSIAAADEGIDFFQQDFNSFASLDSFVQQYNLSNDDVFAECSALIASALPILNLGSTELHEMNIDIYLRLERSQGGIARALVNAKAKKYVQSFSNHTTFTEKESIVRRASKAIMMCRGFYHSVT